MRKCCGCAEVKSFAEFHKNKSDKSGYTWLCKMCANERQAQRWWEKRGGEEAREQYRLKKQRRQELQVEGKKICPRCKQVRLIQEFGLQRKDRPGRHGWCVSCNSEYQKQCKARNSKLEILDQGSKSCTKCKGEKQYSEFHRTNKILDGYMSQCKQCIADYHIRRKYNMSMDEFDAMVQAQKGRCAICDCLTDSKADFQLGKRLVVDHDHETKVVRELTCGMCNSGLGQFDENPETLRKAADYLEKHKRLYEEARALGAFKD